MAQWVKMLYTKPDDLSSLPRPYVVERENHSLALAEITNYKRKIKLRIQIKHS